MEPVLVLLLIFLGCLVWLRRLNKAPNRRASEDRADEARAETLASEPEPASQEPQPSPTRGRIRFRDNPIYSQACLSPEEELDLVTVDGDGIPNFLLAEKWGQLVFYLPDHGLINDESRLLYRHHIFSFHVRGATFYKASIARTNLWPGRELKLVREPDNKFDPNAISIQAPNGAKPLGYVNKLNAKRLAPRIDSGEPFKVIVLAVWPWQDSAGFSALAGRPHVIDYLLAHVTREPSELDHIDPTPPRNSSPSTS